MINDLIHRRASINEHSYIIKHLVPNNFRKTKESNHATDEVNQHYPNTSEKIRHDPNQYIIIIGTYLLTLMPSLYFMGSTHLQINPVDFTSYVKRLNMDKWMSERTIHKVMQSKK